MSKNCINYYNTNLAEFESMSATEERRLITAAQNGNVDARNRIVESNLRFVLTIALQYHPKNLTTDDLVGYGNVGLIEAVSRFDIHQENRFLTFARFWIVREITDALRNFDRTVRIPASMLAKVSQGKKSESELTSAVSASSFNAAVTGDTGSDAFENIEDDVNVSVEEAAERQELLEIIEEFADTLTDRERKVLYARAGIGYDKPQSLAKIGSELHLTKTSIQYIENKYREKAKKSSFVRRFEGWYDLAA